MREISILTNQLTVNSILESWFVQNVVLLEIPFGLDWDLESLHDSVVIYLELGEINTDTIKKLQLKNNKVVLFQMGDENKAKYNRDSYLVCDLVLRNYFFRDIFEDLEIKTKTLWIPNGYKSGVGPRNSAMLRKANQRRFLSTFLGWLDNEASFGNERALFRKVATENPQDILLQPTTYFGKGYNVGMYSAIMESSVFCPCPAGNSPETIRLYDALELGCIPICLKHDFLSSHEAFINPPFPLLNSWDELPDLLARYRRSIVIDHQTIVREQCECFTWWDVFKKSLVSQVASRLNGLRRM